MPDSKDAVLPVGSWILVTGVNGFIASHIANQLLQLGYNVRGSVRDLQRSSWIEDLFRRRYGNGRFEIVLVEDVTREGAFDDAIRGVSAVAHVATVLGGTDSPEDFISSVVTMNRNLLAAASKEATVKRFVYTSSSEAAVYTSIDKPGETHVTSQSWNEEAITRVQNSGNGFDVYAASKVFGERAIWEWIEENKPAFVMSTVLPSLCFGSSIDPETQGHASSSGWPVAVFQNRIESIKPIINSIVPRGAYCVDVQDVGLLHIAGLLHPAVKNERLFAFGVPFYWTDIIAIFSRLYPDREFPVDWMESLGENRKLLDIEGAERAESLLKDMGKSGWSSLEDMLKANVADLV